MTQDAPRETSHETSHETALAIRWAAALRSRRKALGLSQQAVAASSRGRLSQSDVSRLERGLLHPTEGLPIEKFLALLGALEWSLAAFSHATGLEVAGRQQAEDLHREALQAASRLEVQPEWLEFPVYGSVAAGEEGGETLPLGWAYIPREKLRARGAVPEDVRVYLVNGDCMISGEAQRVQKNIAPGDYVAVDSRRKPRPGEVVVAYWPAEDKLVVKRYRIEGREIVLYPVNPAHPNLVLPSEDEVFILGTVVWRGG